MQKIRFVGLILTKIEGVKVYESTPGGQPVKILFCLNHLKNLQGVLTVSEPADHPVKDF